MQIPAFTSSAVKNLRTEGETVMVTFPNGKEYTYTCADVESFVSALSSIITEQQSVGSFVNRSIKNETLKQMANA